MKIKIYDTLEIYGLLEGLNSTPLPIKTAYKVAKLIAAVEKEVHFYQNQFASIISKYCQRDAEGNPVYTEEEGEQKVVISKESLPACEKELNELFAFEVEIEDVKISINDLPDTMMTPHNMKLLIGFLEE